MSIKELSEQADELVKEAKTIAMELFASNPSFQKSLRHQKVPLKNIQQKIAALMRCYAELYIDTGKEILPAATVREHGGKEQDEINSNSPIA